MSHHARGSRWWPLRRATAAILLALLPALAHAQPRFDSVEVRIRQPGPGGAGRLLAEVLRSPHLAVYPQVPTLGLPRDTTFDRTIVVIGSDVTVASAVRGDVVVVGGDLFMRPGAAIQGRAIAFGGGVYHTLLGRADRGAIAFRDETFIATRSDDVIVLDHVSLVPRRQTFVTVPGIYGLRAPSYTRVDGLVLPVAPLFAFLGGRIELEPFVTYRSHLGAWDPGLVFTAEPRTGTRVEARLERGTYTNDAWMRNDWVNSAAVLALGEDQRNYFRAWRARGLVHRVWDRHSITLQPRLGAQTEEGWSVGPYPDTRTSPWSAFGRRDSTRMLRPNPEVTAGRLTSALAGVQGDWGGGDVSVRVEVEGELAFDSPLGSSFQQLVAQGAVAFPTFGRQRLETEVRGVITTGDGTPAQRHHYLGGGGTLRTLDPLEMGGDRLFYLESLYLVPLARPVIPYVGPPTLGLFYGVGGAGVTALPPMVQNVGVQLRINLLRVEFVVDPATRERSVGVGLTATR